MLSGSSFVHLFLPVPRHNVGMYWKITPKYPVCQPQIFIAETNWATFFLMNCHLPATTSPRFASNWATFFLMDCHLSGTTSTRLAPMTRGWTSGAGRTWRCHSGRTIGPFYCLLFRSLRLQYLVMLSCLLWLNGVEALEIWTRKTSVNVLFYVIIWCESNSPDLAISVYGSSCTYWSLLHPCYSSFALSFYLLASQSWIGMPRSRHRKERRYVFYHLFFE